MLLKRLICTLVLTSTSATAVAQGFVDGDLYWFSGSAASTPPTAIWRVDPAAGGAASPLGQVPSIAFGTPVYDAYRDRIIYYRPSSPNQGIYSVDSTGVETQITIGGMANPSADYFAARGDGIIYYRTKYGSPFRYIDAAPPYVERTLLDVNGSPFVLNEYISALFYERSSNALFTAVTTLGPTCSASGEITNVVLHRLPLTPDGTALSSAMGSHTFPLSQCAAGGFVMGFSNGPNGSLVFGASVQSSAPSQPGYAWRIVSIDPLDPTLSSVTGLADPLIASFAGVAYNPASNSMLFHTGPVGGCGVGAGHCLKEIALNGQDAGTFFGTVPVSGSSRLIRICRACYPSSFNYCTAGTSSVGCAPTMSVSGTPSAAASSGYVLACTSAEGAQQGLIFYGINGPKSDPWGTSTSFLCIKSPLERTGVQTLAGTLGACDGAMSVDFLAFASTHAGVLGAPVYAGEIFAAQGWYRDPPSPKTTMLSDAIRWTMLP